MLNLSLVRSTFLLVAAVGSQAVAAGLEVSTDTPHSWVVTWDGRPVCVYTYAPGQHKPYVSTLGPLSGENVLRDSPADHLHHHALMYAIRVNGINFWEETAGAGHEVPFGPVTLNQHADDKGRPFARLQHQIAWVAEADARASDPAARALLVETRTLTLTPDASRGGVWLDWDASFQMGPEAKRVELQGSNYNGLGLRLQAALDPVATPIIAGQCPDLADARQAVIPGPWGAIHVERPETPLTIAIIGSPGNPGAPDHYFAMRMPFAYLAATQALDQSPRIHQADESWSLAYRVIVAPGLLDGAAIQALSPFSSSNSPR